MATLVLTLIGDDRAGLVNAVAEVVARHGGNWERSQMAELAGKFAGIVLVTEMTASTAMLLPMIAASFVAMVVPTLLGDPPIYESLRERTLRIEPSVRRPTA